MNYQKNMRFLCFEDIVNPLIIDVFKDLFNNSFIKKKNNLICFFFVDKLFENINELIGTLTVDFGVIIHYHEGFMLNNNISESLIDQYLTLVSKYQLLKMPYSNLFSFLYLVENKDVKDFLDLYKKEVLELIINKQNNRIILNKFFDNNLNVLKTSKDLFINRNSLTIRLESISKALGYNIQQFKNASMLMYLMNLK